MSKKTPGNNFPSNFRSLPSTGMLDGVPVQYIAWSQELDGVIKGSGYLCGCQMCIFSKVINAYESEQHDTPIIKYTLRVGRLSMELSKGYEACFRICCLMLCRQ